MSENKIELKSIKELLGMQFFIPNYQRGYRWTEQQVTDLLNDILEFSQKNNSLSEFYCLQPLVVKKKHENILKKIKEEAQTIEEIETLLKGTWEVIDGQQRLTTIFIILSVLKYDNKYSLSYETRETFNEFLKILEPFNLEDSYEKKDILNQNWNNLIEHNKDKDNIDFYHIFNAYHIVRLWLSRVENPNSFKETLLNKVKFIWYESINEDSIEVFTRLNIGKIPLTNSELIKALLLNSSNFKEIDTNHLRLRQQEIATEWDNIEFTLQNEEFWLFIHKIGYEKPTRIDFIFDLIVEQNSLKISEDKNNKIGTDAYRTFRYFYEYFSDIKNEEKVKCCWREVKKYFQTFQEWFNDLKMYHYVGYLVELGVPLKSLYALWSGDKNNFINGLETKIKEHLKIKKCLNLDEIYEIDYTNEYGNSIKGKTKTACKPILLLHNIQTIINQANINQEEYQQRVFYKFPFHLYKTENWDVEHIDSNTQNDISDKTSQNEFLLNIYHAVNEDTKKNIQHFINDSNASNWSDFESYLKLPEEYFSQEEKNQIWNFALLDSTTNRSYGNSIFSAKRRIIIGKDRGVLLPIPKMNKSGSEMLIGEEEKAKSAFIPPCTKQIFLKYYTPMTTDYNYWTRSDAEAYKQNILETLKHFGVTLNK